MALATVAEFKAFFDEFSSTADAKIQLYLDVVKNQVSESDFGENQKYAHALLAAHKISLVSGLAEREASKSNVKKEKAGDIETTYQDQNETSSGDQNLKLTMYGTEFLELCPKFGGFTI